jgi:hypothetical protein
MTYLLEKISLQDQGKIISDASNDPPKQRELTYARDHRDFAETWAFDRERNFYLFMAPTTTRPESIDRPYLMFFQGAFYRINTEGAAGHLVYFDEDPPPPESLVAELQEEVRAAFAIYGRYGSGPLNKRGVPVYAIVAEFKERG